MKFFGLAKAKWLGVVLAGVVVFTSLGGAVYAANGDWADLLRRGIDKIYTLVFPEIEERTEAKKESIIDRIKKDIRTIMKDTGKTIVKYRDDLIKRNEKELEDYYKEQKQVIKSTKDTIVQEKKEKLKQKADQELRESKEAIREEIEEELEDMIDD